MGTVKKRQSNIELLRIVAILMIIAHHLLVEPIWGGFSSDDTGYLLTLIGSFGKVGVGIFFVISGYFMATSKDLNPRKLLPLVRRVWFYAFSCLLIALIFFPGMIQLSFPLHKDVLSSIFPIATNLYWFFTSFVIIRLLYPYIRPWFDRMSNRDIKRLFLIITAILIIPRIITILLGSYTEDIFSIPSAVYFSFLGYMLARFPKAISLKQSIITVVVLMAVIFLIPSFVYALNSLGYDLNVYMLTYADNLLNIMLVAAIFTIFKSIRFSSRFVNYVGGTVFGIYLIHENVFVRKIIWSDKSMMIRGISEASDGFVAMAYIIVSIVGIFVVCCVIEIIRQTVVKLFVRRR